jgi:membrane-associated protease RseP (regulator of RpoE activity)
VALSNMLPVGIFDGGRFFYLLVLSITKSEKAAKTAFNISTYLLLGFFALLIIVWFFGFLF